MCMTFYTCYHAPWHWKSFHFKHINYLLFVDIWSIWELVLSSPALIFTKSAAVATTLKGSPSCDLFGGRWTWLCALWKGFLTRKRCFHPANGIPYPSQLLMFCHKMVHDHFKWRYHSKFEPLCWTLLKDTIWYCPFTCFSGSPPWPKPILESPFPNTPLFISTSGTSSSLESTSCSSFGDFSSSNTCSLRSSESSKCFCIFCCSRLAASLRTPCSSLPSLSLREIRMQFHFAKAILYLTNQSPTWWLPWHK